MQHRGDGEEEESGECGEQDVGDEESGAVGTGLACGGDDEETDLTEEDEHEGGDEEELNEPCPAGEFAGPGLFVAVG